MVGKKIWFWSKLLYLWPKAVIKLTEQKQNNKIRSIMIFRVSCESSCLSRVGVNSRHFVKALLQKLFCHVNQGIIFDKSPKTNNRQVINFILYWNPIIKKSTLLFGLLCVPFIRWHPSYADTRVVGAAPLGGGLPGCSLQAVGSQSRGPRQSLCHSIRSLPWAKFHCLTPAYGLCFIPVFLVNICSPVFFGWNSENRSMDWFEVLISSKWDWRNHWY